MTTEQATKELAWVYAYGSTSPKSAISDIHASRAIKSLVDAAIAQSKAWNWDKANAALEGAYKTLGAVPPEVKINALHTGRHPVQIAAAEIMA